MVLRPCHAQGEGEREGERRREKEKEEEKRREKRREKQKAREKGDPPPSKRMALAEPTLQASVLAGKRCASRGTAQQRSIWPYLFETPHFELALAFRRVPDSPGMSSTSETAEKLTAAIIK